MRSAGGACGISGSGMSNTTGGGPASCAGALGVGASLGPERGSRCGCGLRAGSATARRSDGRLDRRRRLVLLPTLLAAQRALILGVGCRQRRVLGLLRTILLLALLLLRRLGRALPGRRRTAGGDQIGRHRGAHLRTGGVVLAQEARDVTALGESLRALVASRTGRGEDPGRVPRVGELRLCPQLRPAYPDRQDRPNENNAPEARHLKPPHRRRPPRQRRPSTLSAFAGRREPKLQPCPPPLPHCR